MDETTQPTQLGPDRSAAPYERCGRCARCATGTGRRPDPNSRDCLDLHLSRAVTDPQAPRPAPSITASISGHMDEAPFGSFTDAGSALWAVLRTLPLGYVQAAAYRHLLVDDVSQIEPLFQHRATVQLTFELGNGARHAVTITHT